MSTLIQGIPDVPNGNITSATAFAEHHYQLSPLTTILDESKGYPIKSFSSITPPSSPQALISSIKELGKLSILEPIKLTLKITLLDSIEVQWETLLVNEILYVYLTNMPTGNSKEAFIALLEFAEEELHCKKVVAYFDKQNPERSNGLTRI